MLLLTSTSALVQVITGGTQTVHVHASWVDINGTTVTATGDNTVITTATTTTVVTSPAASTQRNVKFLSIQNTDASASDAITVQHNDGTTAIKLFNITLLAGYTLTYNDLDGWMLYNASGGRIESAVTGSGQLVKTTLIQTGTTTFTTQPSTNRIQAELLGSGGSGGGCPTTSGEHGSGGGAGGYALWDVAVSPSTAYTCAVGASKTGTSAASGTAGSATTLTIGATTCTANGGTQGLVGNSVTIPVAGGGASAISTNGTVNAAGEPGDSSQPGAGVGNAGAGGSTAFGAGGGPRTTAGAGNAAVGFGGGGGGAWTSGSPAAGGASSAGMILIREYS